MVLGALEARVLADLVEESGDINFFKFIATRIHARTPSLFGNLTTIKKLQNRFKNERAKYKPVSRRRTASPTSAAAAAADCR